jgi:hypothetical protein
MVMVIGSGRENFKDICDLNILIKRASIVDKCEVEIYKHLSLYVCSLCIWLILNIC